MRTTSVLGALLASLTACGGSVAQLDAGRRDGSSAIDGKTPLSDSALDVVDAFDGDSASDGDAFDGGSLSDAFDGGSPSDAAACGEDGACAMGSVCAEDLCIPCREPGMPCCAGGLCDPPANSCYIGKVCRPMR
jgi:hypothetical protein